MTTLWIVLIASFAMIAQDVIATIMMQTEAKSLGFTPPTGWWDWRTLIGGGWHRWLAPVLDEAQWIVGITTTFVSVEAFAGHDLMRKALVFVGVSIANLIGSKLGQEMGLLILSKKQVKGAS